MKAVQYRSYGDYSENRVVDLPRPEPRDGEVLVEMRAVGVNPLDNTFRSGEIFFALAQNLPRIGGQSGAGVVAESKSDAFKAGGPRLCRGAGSWPAGRRRLAGIRGRSAPPPCRRFRTGSTTITPAAYLAGAGYLTGYLALTELAKFKAGQSVLAPAIGGAVGMETVQVARRLGASFAISTASSTEKAERARAAGYEHVIDLSRENLKDAVMRITEGKGVDVVVDGGQRAG